MTADSDYEELVRVLKREFGAVEESHLLGPYSVHKYFNLDGFRLGVILDTPDWLDLYARDERDRSAMDSFVAQLLSSLNGPERASAGGTP
jgi:hypothetical protein